eukprot:scaffold38024_cov17-Tisochrysis_lutea.AAC.4
MGFKKKTQGMKGSSVLVKPPRSSGSVEKTNAACRGERGYNSIVALEAHFYGLALSSWCACGAV